MSVTSKSTKLSPKASLEVKLYAKEYLEALHNKIEFSRPNLGSNRYVTFSLGINASVTQ